MLHDHLSELGYLDSLIWLYKTLRESLYRRLSCHLLYRQMYGTLPAGKPLMVRAPLFVPGSKFAAPDPVSQPLLPTIPLAGGYDCAAMEMTAG